MTKKVVTIVGARPQFIKAAVVSHAMASSVDLEEVLIHTGQHFDKNMSQTFFDELSIPKPKLNLGISGGTHAEMTAKMLIAIERALSDENPDAVLLYGDTNSTLAAALAAAKLHIPIIHVEAGARTRSRTNPEEINRICTDHIGTLLLACTQDSLRNLEAEGLGDRSENVGDPMLDAFLGYREIATKPALKDAISSSPVELPSCYYYLTCHREENTGSEEPLEQILDAADQLDAPAVYPIHPRVKARFSDLLEKRANGNTLFVDPVGYLESIFLTDHAEQVITDSGGLQREAFFANVKCTTILDFEVWPETLVNGRNILARPERESIIAAMEIPQSIDPGYQPFGDGRASERIVDAAVDMIEGV